MSAEDELRIEELESALKEALDICDYAQQRIGDLTIGEYRLIKNSIGKYDVISPDGSDLGSYSFIGAIDRVRKHEKRSNE